MSKPMTNYNERLDKIVHQLAKDIDFEQYRFSKGSVDSEFHNYAMEKYEVEAKQALTSLIKELVAEAKPTIYPYYTSPTNNGYEKSLYFAAIEQFEQNLLKALDEK